VSARRLLEICALAFAAGGCTRVVDAVIPNGAGMVCTQQSTDLACAPTPWPTDGHTANSDPWLVTHNQVITSMSPSVLVLNFDTAQTTTQTTDYANQIIAALAAGSIYHGYSNASATPFITYQIAKVVDLTTVAPPVASDAPTLLDPTALFNDPTFPPLYGYPDGSGGFLSLCALFEKGLVNEVWIQDGGDAQTTPRAPLFAERKQIYGDDGFAVPGAFKKNAGGFIGGAVADFSLSVSCKVTVRVSHLDPSSNGGPGCDVMVRGWGIEGMWSALPSSLSTEAYAFLNHDFNTKFGLSAFGWPDICGGVAPCVSYPSPTHATSASTTPSFDVPNFLQGCGNVLFPPNATQAYDFDDSTYQVDSRCEGFGLGGGPNDGDQYKTYVANQTITTYDQAYTGNSRSCPAGWQIYWRQSMPGYLNQAKLTDGTPMPNWWPMLFY
jgi:hypothetical protein